MNTYPDADALFRQAISEANGSGGRYVTLGASGLSVWVEDDRFTAADYPLEPPAPTLIEPRALIGYACLAFFAGLLVGAAILKAAT